MSQPGSEQQPDQPLNGQHAFACQPYPQQPYAQQPYAQATYPQSPYAEQDGPPFYFPDLEGANFKSKATTYAIIGIFVFGFVFGPLAIRNAGRAEANGVPATFGKVAGWIVTVLSCIYIVFWAVVLISGAVYGMSSHS
ncbi:hypothetical protein [Paenarthrobacter ilicis]|uniref:DUF4190 domain-containing protein n=1 Tax=Paenarthrobacter ilicis TaxID=43665 RepID=A0ABX0THS1_9MICC|nr:hypothetical protein [Paenarthrobacter ilicis]MBM7791984.1 hypothetical protein [Paenarthrobacter ilicis]NIJ01391.1 hypothetical protein [Paenarthrobacter ilicis]